jgi:DNA-binding LacI/PurR family transcriptional regulator
MAERQQKRAELVGMLRCTAGVHPHLNTDAQAMLYKAAHLLEDDGKEIARLDHERGDWTGRKCSQCSGHGRKTDEDGEERRCDACAGTGDEWLFWKDRAEKAEAERDRVRELVKQAADELEAIGIVNNRLERALLRACADEGKDQ